MKDTPKGWPRITTAIFYQDAAAAIDWLCAAFGFEVRLKIEGEIVPMARFITFSATGRRG